MSVLRSFTRNRIRSLKTEERERKKNKAQTRVGFVRIKIAYRLKSPVRDARRRPTIIEGLWRVQQECCVVRRSCKNTKQKRIPLLFKKTEENKVACSSCRERVQYAVLRIPSGSSE